MDSSDSQSKSLTAHRTGDRDKESAFHLQDPIPSSDAPLVANFQSADCTIGAGVAIFHLASSRVVVCYHSAEKYWFLPKGRRDAGEGSGTGAEREGFEEVKHSSTTALQEPTMLQSSF